MSLLLSPQQFCFCPSVASHYIALTEVSNGSHVTKSSGYLSVLIFLDHPLLITLFFLKSSFYFALVASFVFLQPFWPFCFCCPILWGSCLGPLPTSVHSWGREGGDLFSAKLTITISMARKICVSSPKVSHEPQLQIPIWSWDTTTYMFLRYLRLTHSKRNSHLPPLCFPS